MKRLLITIVILLATAISATAQTTTVTGTITDPQGNPYQNGTASAQKVVSSGQNPGPPFNTTTNAAGLFSFSGLLALPSPASYIFTICAAPANIGPKANLTPVQQCFANTVPIAISGASQDVSATLNVLAPALGPSLSNIQGANNNFTGNNSFINLTVSGNMTATVGQNQYSVFSLNGKVLVDNIKYPCTGSGLNSAIAALPAGGGTVDATACASPNTIGVTVTSASVNNVIILLGPYVWTTTVYPAFKIQSVSGNKIIGYYGDTPNASSPLSSFGTIIRSTGTLTGTSDLIDVIGSTSTEVGGLVLDFNQATPASGQYGVYSSSLLHENIHDIEVYNAGVDCFRWDTANGGPTYDTVAKNLRCQTANTEGFMLLSQSASGNDLARWYCINCSFLGTPQGSVTHFGVYGFHLQIPAVNGQILGDVVCDACFANQTVSGASNAAVFFDQAGTVKMYDIKFSGGFEDTSAANTGSAIRAVTGTTCGIDGVFVHYGQANFATSDNLIGNTGVCTVIDQFQAASGSGTRTLSFDKVVSGGPNANAAQGDLACGRNANTCGIYFGTDGAVNFFRNTGPQMILNGAWLDFTQFAAFDEQAQPAGSGIATKDSLYGDSTTHALAANYNNSGITNFVPKTIALTADWTCGTGGTVASCTSATIIGSGGGVPLTLPLPLANNSETFVCDGVVGQATAVTANQWNLLTATNGAANVTATYSMATATTASAYGAVTDQASTTTTFQIAPSWTLGAITTKMPFHIWAKIEGASASGTVLSLQLLAPTVGDLVTIYRGTSCTIF